MARVEAPEVTNIEARRPSTTALRILAALIAGSLALPAGEIAQQLAFGWEQNHTEEFILIELMIGAVLYGPLGYVMTKNKFPLLFGLGMVIPYGLVLAYGKYVSNGGLEMIDVLQTMSYAAGSVGIVAVVVTILRVIGRTLFRKS